jgi:KaiC/GvpD/RAD55 family RecA-like ATPase
MGSQMEKKTTPSPPTAPIGIRKIPTQIEGLDDILYGGLPAGRTTLISGGPCTGKSVFGLEFLYRGALSGDPGIFLSFKETAASIRQNAFTFGWDLVSLEQAGKQGIFLTPALIKVSPQPRTTIFGDLSNTREVLKALRLMGGE